MSDPSQGAKSVKKEVLTTFEASRYLNVAPKTVSNWIDAGHLKAYRTVGGHRRIRREDLEAFLSAQRTGRRLRAPARGKRVLVVDDESPVVETILQALREADPPYEVDSAASGFEAGLKLAEAAPDLLILDTALPGARPAEILRSLRSRPVGQEIKVLALTGPGAQDQADEWLRQGASRCMAKPVDPSQLRREVALLLGQP
jgi:excisionase family DNA binding protein